MPKRRLYVLDAAQDGESPYGGHGWADSAEAFAASLRTRLIEGGEDEGSVTEHIRDQDVRLASRSEELEWRDLGMPGG